MRSPRSFFILVLLGTMQPVFAQQRVRLEMDYRGQPVVLEADRQSRESAVRWVAEGNVVLTYQGAVLRAPRLVYNPQSGMVVADGPLKLTRGLGWLTGSRAQVNVRDNTGVIYDAEGFTDQELFVRGKRVVMTGPGRFEVHNGFLTACEESVPKWSFTVKNAHIVQGGTARATNTLFRVKKIPVFYLPITFIPTGKKKRSSGFLLPSVGNSNNKGRRLSQSFYLVLGRSADLTLREDYFSERGFGQGVSFRTRPHEQSHLEVDWYFVNDRKNQGGTMFTGTGETRLPNGYRAVADFNLVSNFTFRQVFSDNFYTATRPIDNSRVFISNSRRALSFNFLVAREETRFPGRKNIIIRHTPSIGLGLSGQRIAETPIFLDLDASIGGISRDDPELETPGVIQRLDLFPRLYFSVPLFQGLRATPTVGVRETFYSDSLVGGSDPSQGNLTGDNTERRYFEFTLDLEGWGLSRVYHPGQANSFKHLIEPTLRYRYVTGIDNFDRILRFDDTDIVVNTNEVEYGLVNRFFVKRQGPDGPYSHEWLSIKVAQKYFIDPDFNGALEPGEVNQFFPLTTLTGFPFGALERRFSPITALVRFSPTSRYSFDVRGDYDPDFDTFRNFSVTGFLRYSSLYLGTTYFVTRQLEQGTFESNQLQAQIAWGHLKKGLSLSTTFSYDARTDQFLTLRTRVNYFWDCCGVSLEFQKFNVGARQEEAVFFSFFLKGIGTFGTIRRPDSIF